MTRSEGTEPSLRAVIFDVDGTLYRQGPLRKAMAVKMARAYALHPLRGWRVAKVISAYRKCQEEMRHEPPSDGLTDRQLQTAAERTGVPKADVERYVGQWMESAPLEILQKFAQPDLVASLERLRRAGLRLAVLSDYPAEDKLRALGVFDFFELVLSAQDSTIGVFKPDPKGLRVTHERLGLLSTEVMYVGDRASVDAAAASAAQMRCTIVGSPGRGERGPFDYVQATSFLQMATMTEAL